MTDLQSMSITITVQICHCAIHAKENDDKRQEQNTLRLCSSVFIVFVLSDIIIYKAIPEPPRSCSEVTVVFTYHGMVGSEN